MTFDTVSGLGIPNLQPGAPLTWGIPLVSFSGNGFAAIGDVQDGPFAIDDNTLQLVDNVAWNHGKHALRFGFEYCRQNFNQIGNQFSRGQFAFQANATQSSARTGGDAFADFLLGDVFQSTVAVALATAEFQRNAEAAFADDTWKISPKVTTSGIRVQGFDTLYAQNSYCLACERGLSAFDTRQRIVTSVLYDLPVGKGKALHINNGFANTIIGGWQLGGILTLQSGMPGTLSIGGVDNAGTAAGGYDRPNATGVTPYIENATPSGYWNLDAYVEAPPGQFGNVGRNSILGPGIIGFDAEVHKQFRMPYSEHHTLQFRFEAFNAMNHPNWNMPNLNILSGAVRSGLPGTAAHANFGVVTGTSGAMRQLQLALKYSF